MIPNGKSKKSRFLLFNIQHIKSLCFHSLIRFKFIIVEIIFLDEKFVKLLVVVYNIEITNTAIYTSHEIHLSKNCGNKSACESK